MENRYGSLRVEGVKSNAVSGRAIHNQRDYTNEREAPEHINKKLSKHNIYIDENGEILKKKDHYMRINNAIKLASIDHKNETGRAVRKDANLMVDMVFYRSDLDLKSEKKFNNKLWLKDTVEWVKKRFGAENMIGGALHIDEPDKKTGKVHPHIHLMIHPRSAGEKRISMDRLFPMGTYSKLQTEYYQSVGKKHGLVRGEKRDSSYKHIKTNEFKKKIKRHEANLIKQAQKNPKKAIKMMEELGPYYATSLASQEVMKERLEKDFEIERNKQSAYFHNAQKEMAENLTASNYSLLEISEDMRKIQAENDLLKIRNECLEEQNSNLTTQNDKYNNQIRVRDETLLFGNDEAKTSLNNQIKKLYKAEGIKSPKLLENSKRLPEFQHTQKAKKKTRENDYSR